MSLKTTCAGRSFIVRSRTEKPSLSWVERSPPCFKKTQQIQILLMVQLVPKSIRIFSHQNSCWRKQKWKACLFYLYELYLDEWCETVNLSIESAAMQSSPARFLILYHQVWALTLQQPLQQSLLSLRGCEVKRRAAKGVAQGGCIVTIWRQKRLELPLRSPS